MECREAIELMEQCFDEGEENSPTLNTHLAECAECRVKADEIKSIGQVLYAMPFEAPRGIEDRVMTALMQEHGHRKREVALSVFTICALTTAIALNLVLPLRQIEDRFLGYIQTWIPETPWLGSGRSYREQFEMVWSNGFGYIERIEWLSASTMWSTLAATVILAVILNGICVVQLRHSSR